MAEEKNEAPLPEGAKESLDFHYVKSSLFRVIHADGAHGGVTGRGYLQMTFYNERNSLPVQSTATINQETGQLSETTTESKNGVERELECSILMDENAVKSLHAWLGSKISDFERIRAAIAELEKKK